MGHPAPAVAGLWVANALVGSPLTYGTLLDMAAAMEGHADNAAAAALGGLVVARLGQAGAVTAIRVPMPRGELVAALAEATHTDKKAAGAALEALTGIITQTVTEGGAVTLPGIGKIYCRERPERTARNPSTGEQIQKPADKVVKNTVAKALKDSINT